MGLCRCYIGKYGDNSDSAQGQNGYDLVVITGINIHNALSDGCQVSDLADVAAGFLDTYDVLHVLTQLHYGLRQNIAAGTAGYVIQNSGNLHRIRNGLEMTIQSLLGCFIIVGTYQQNAVHAVFLRFLRQVYCSLGTIGTGTCYYGDSLCNFVHTVFDSIQMLLMGQGR